MRKLQKALFIAACAAATYAHSKPAAAHFKLLKPTSWLKEDTAGGPQKGGPCGPGGYDNVNPTPTSGAITEFHAGETIEVDWVDTVGHPGYFRIALAANRNDFKNPTVVQDANCDFPDSMVPTMASGNVLADGVHFRAPLPNNAAFPAGTMFTQMVKLPDQPCDKCTLQVMQVMEHDAKFLSQCYYFHCADVRILPAVAGTGGTTGSGGTTSTGMAGSTGISMGGSGGMVILPPSSGGTLGAGGLVGMGTGPLGGTTSTPGAGATGTVTTPPSTSTGATGPGAPVGTAGATELGGAAGTGANGTSAKSDGTSCAVVLGTRARNAVPIGIGALALLTLARRRHARRVGRKSSQYR